MLNILNPEFWRNTLFSLTLVLAAVVVLPEITDWLINAPWEDKKGQKGKSSREDAGSPRPSFAQYALNTLKNTGITYAVLMLLGLALLIARKISTNIDAAIAKGTIDIPRIDLAINISFLNYYIKFFCTWLVLLLTVAAVYIAFRVVLSGLKNKEVLPEAQDKPVEPAIELIEGPLKEGCPPLSLLDKYSHAQSGAQDTGMRSRLQQCFDEYGLSFLSIVKVETGPTITRFTVRMDTSGRLGAVLKIEKEMSMYLGVTAISIISSAEGVIIDVPNSKKSKVAFREVLQIFAGRKSSGPLSVPLGKTAVGELQAIAINEAPHLLIAGTTGSGKSVCINEIIASILFTSSPDEVRFIFVDPKVVEMSCYNGIPHLLAPVVTDPEKAAKMLDWAVQEMESRYKELAEAGVRNITAYNEKKRKQENRMPFIVIVIDELADLMVVAKKGKNKNENSVEESIQRLGQKARAAGIHLIVGTQRPSADVITGTIKTNIPARVAFTTSSGIDSRIILGENGAEKLLGKGDGLLLTIGAPVRFQSAYISDQEVERVVEWWKGKGTENKGEILDWDNVRGEADSYTESEAESNNGSLDRPEELPKNYARDDYYSNIKLYVAKLAAGDEEELYLPSTRQIEEDLGINHRYVIEGLQKLVSEKWIEKVGSSPRTMRYMVTLSQDDAMLELDKNAV
ncbi:FtsK/SpoIIIE family protein [Anaerobacterium chartisolvens]|uniref:FtsK/SpoIIIE family protein n=1 Tax=Anaerobacterium chartisolvens TaxID=1297424 RepID=A0A369AN11_9FIRM|nr:DNA translocase FtsK [Anaerobacterium chartisolvens]RCX10443.1 FtsK/SpoIIIE family protein [Anaerobacterium chartisolvens]